MRIKPLRLVKEAVRGDRGSVCSDVEHMGKLCTILPLRSHRRVSNLFPQRNRCFSHARICTKHCSAAGQQRRMSMNTVTCGERGKPCWFGQQTALTPVRTGGIKISETPS